MTESHPGEEQTVSGVPVESTEEQPRCEARTWLGGKRIKWCALPGGHIGFHKLPDGREFGGSLGPPASTSPAVEAAEEQPFNQFASVWPRDSDGRLAPTSPAPESAESRQCAVCGNEITASSGEWWIPEQILHADDVTDHRAVYVRDWQAAAIRAPLEERIRELERKVGEWHKAYDASQENAADYLQQRNDWRAKWEQAVEEWGSRAETAEAALLGALVEIDGNPLRAIAIIERALSTAPSTEELGE